MKMINKPTKKELLQIYYLEREIKNLQRIIDNLSDVDIKSPMSAEVIVSPTNNPGNPTATVGVNPRSLRAHGNATDPRAAERHLRGGGRRGPRGLLPGGGGVPERAGGASPADGGQQGAAGVHRGAGLRQSALRPGAPHVGGASLL